MFKIIYAAFLANKKGDETLKPNVNGITIFFMIKTVISICVFIFLMKRMAKLMPELLWNIMTGFQYLSMTLTVIFAAKAVLKKSWRCAVASFLCFILNCVFSIAKIIVIKNISLSTVRISPKLFLVFIALFSLGVLSGIVIKEVAAIKAKSNFSWLIFLLFLPWFRGVFCE